MRYSMSVFVFLACCMAQGLEFDNLKFFPVKHPECRGFVVIREMLTSYRFYYVSRTNTLEVMLVPPKEMNICSVESVEQSPDGDKVVILSVGEGHPALAIYHISDLIAQADKTRKHAESSWGDLEDSYTLPCLANLDPYPGLCAEPKWVESDAIEFTASGVDFREFDPVTRRAKQMETTVHSVEVWRWQYTDDTFTLMKTDVVPSPPKRLPVRLEQIKQRIRPPR